ncbi:HAD family hydrolase [Rhodopseudomonas telluris]|uniref:HAD family hydrolase n=1 Tax=Rhodopseudomonas telluris TaxID=644215 RepID=A0ABV6EPG2_9BRAD
MISIHDAQRFGTFPDAVLFDTDNTLYSYAEAHEAGMEAVRAKATRTFAIDVGTFDRAFDSARHQVKGRLKHTAASHSRLLYFQRMLEIIGLGSQVLMALDLEQTYWRTFLSNAILFDGVKELLDDLRLRGIPTAVITDLTAQIQFRKIVYFGLDHYFDYIVTSEESGYDKPHEAPFRIAVEKMQPKGVNLWMIGDNPETDVRGARKCLNATTLQKVHKGVVVGAGEDRPDATFADFADLIRLLERIERGGGPEKLAVGARQ